MFFLDFSDSEDPFEGGTSLQTGRKGGFVVGLQFVPRNCRLLGRENVYHQGKSAWV